MIMMMRQERRVSDGLLLERKKKTPSNPIQRIGFDCSKEARVS